MKSKDRRTPKGHQNLDKGQIGKVKGQNEQSQWSSDQGVTEEGEGENNVERIDRSRDKFSGEQGEGE